MSMNPLHYPNYNDSANNAFPQNIGDKSRHDKCKIFNKYEFERNVYIIPGSPQITPRFRGHLAVLQHTRSLQFDIVGSVPLHLD